MNRHARIPRISEAEWEVMNIVWARTPRSAAEIIESLQKNFPDWHPATVKTLINRLVKKKALGFRKEGRAYLYEPLVTREDCVSAVSESFLDRVFGGALKPMLAHFVESRKLSPREIGELRKLLEKTEEK
jgi:BlaI family transcriptional regulator, penicillinase repressor